jgi:hypothetical protein
VFDLIRSESLKALTSDNNMKPKHFLSALALAGLTACSTTTSEHSPPRDDTETVMAIYHVRMGQEVNFHGLLTRAWETYRGEHMVFAQPHVIVQDREANGKTRFIEIFTWVSHTAPQNAPDSVKQVWAREQSLCEARDGHNALEGGEVDLILPRQK